MCQRTKNAVEDDPPAGAKGNNVKYKGNNNNNNDFDQDDNDNDDNPFVGRRGAFFMTLISHSLFFVASVLYIYLAVLQLHYEQMIRHFPDDVLAADDDVSWTAYGYEDDYILQAPITQRWISKYTVVYFCAALCFLLSGLVELYQWRDWFSLLMITAAALGLASACYGETNLVRSERLNVASVHIWLLDALMLLFYHRTRYGRSDHLWLRCALVMAAMSFVIGTFMDVVLSWLYIVAVIQNRADRIVRLGIPLTVTELVAASFWMVAATIFATVTLVLGGRAGAVDERRSLSSSRHEHHKPPSKATTVDDTVADNTKRGHEDSTHHLDEEDGHDDHDKHSTIYYV